MLRGISPILPPELLRILAEMGHGDEIVIGDGNFTAKSLAQRLVRCDGNNVPELLEAIMPLFPLDTYVLKPAMVMEIPEDDKKMFQATNGRPPRWSEFLRIIQQYEKNFSEFEEIERFNFYERSKKAFVIVASGDKEVFANIILKKGVL